MKLNQAVRVQFKKILIWQFIVIFGFALTIFALAGLHKAASVLAGSFAYWIPTAGFLWRVTSYGGARASMQFLVVFLVSETAKLLLSAVLFLMAVKYGSANVLFSLFGLVVAIVAFWITSVLSVYKEGMKP